MKRPFRLFIARYWLIILLASCAQWVFASDAYRPVDRLIVKFKEEPGFSASALPSAVALTTLTRLEARSSIKTRLLKKMASGAQVVQVSQDLSRAELLSVLFQLNQSADVEYAEPDLWMVPSETDANYAKSQWNLMSAEAFGVNAHPAWNASTGVGVVVAVIDSGVIPHEDLLDNLLSGHDFISDVFTSADGDGRDPNAMDPGDFIPAGECGFEKSVASTWHGTKVAGIVAATNNGFGITGVAHNAKILPVRVLGRCGGYSSDIIDAIHWLAGDAVAGVPRLNHKVDVINLSLNSDSPSVCGNAYQQAINAAVNAGKVVVASTGNGWNEKGGADDFPPANCNGVISVAATSKFGVIAQYSNLGSTVSISAPGGNYQGVISTTTDSIEAYEVAKDSYKEDSGTSFAAAHVSGVVALLRGAYPEASLADIKAVIQATATPFSEECQGCGAGIINAARAVEGILDLEVSRRITDLSVTMSSENGAFVPVLGSNLGVIQFKIMLENESQYPASDVELRVIIPEKTVLSSIDVGSGSANCDLIRGVCDFAEVLPGAKETLMVRIETSELQTMEFSADVSSNETDVDESDNVVTAMFGGSMGLSFVFALLMLLLIRCQFWKQPAIKAF